MLNTYSKAEQYDDAKYRAQTLVDIVGWHLEQIRTIKSPVQYIADVPKEIFEGFSDLVLRHDFATWPPLPEGETPLTSWRWEATKDLRDVLNPELSNWVQGQLGHDNYRIRILCLRTGGYIRPHVDYMPQHHVIPLNMTSESVIGFQSYGEAELENSKLYSMDVTREHYSFNRGVDRFMVSITPILRDYSNLWTPNEREAH